MPRITAPARAPLKWVIVGSHHLETAKFHIGGSATSVRIVRDVAAPDVDHYTPVRNGTPPPDLFFLPAGPQKPALTPRGPAAPCGPTLLSTT